MDVNEEIIRTWLQLCKNQFSMDNITFKVYGKKGGGGYSNIDLLGIDAHGRVYDYEVKWRSRFSMSLKDKGYDDAISQMGRKERKKKIREIIGKKYYKKIYITTYKHFGKSAKKREAIEKILNRKNITVLYFENIIPELIDKINTTGRYDSPILQTIRMLKYFDLVKTQAQFDSEKY